MLIFHIGGQKNAVPGHTSSSAAPSREYKLSKTGNRKTPINLINFTYEKKISMKCETFFQKAGDSSCSDFTVLAPCERGRLENWKSLREAEKHLLHVTSWTAATAERLLTLSILSKYDDMHGLLAEETLLPLSPHWDTQSQDTQR